MTAALDLASWVLLLGGVLFAFLGSLGVLRFPDVYARIHGAGMTDTLGAGLMLVGLALQAGHWSVVVRLALILAFLAATSPMTSYALGRAAMGDGVAPLTTAAPETQEVVASSR